MKLWFKAKRYGSGWYPATWEGWLVTLLYVVLMVTVAAAVDETAQPRNATVAVVVMTWIVLTAALLVICYATGEKPRWRWGKD